MKRTMLTAALLAIHLPAQPLLASGEAESFSDWDLNGDGQVSLAEVESNLSNAFLYFDTNNDGYLDQHDTTPEQADSDEEADYSVEFDDDNADNRVSLAEFTSRASEWIAAMDRNGDGSVTLEDFGGTGFN